MTTGTRGARKLDGGTVVLLVASGLFVLGMIIFLLLLTRNPHPHLSGPGPEAKALVLTSTLKILRSAIAQFRTDTGVYPAHLQDVMLVTAPTVGAGGVTIPPGSYKGPYVFTGGGIGSTGLPLNPFELTKSSLVADHWTYNPADGSVRSAVVGTTWDGVAYTAL